MNPLLPGIRRGIDVSPMRSTVKLNLAATGSKSTKNVNKGVIHALPMPKPRIIPGGGVGNHQVAKSTARTRDSIPPTGAGAGVGTETFSQSANKYLFTELPSLNPLTQAAIATMTNTTASATH